MNEVATPNSTCDLADVPTVEEKFNLSVNDPRIAAMVERNRDLVSSLKDQSDELEAVDMQGEARYWVKRDK